MLDIQKLRGRVTRNLVWLAAFEDIRKRVTERRRVLKSSGPTSMGQDRNPAVPLMKHVE